MLTGLNNLSSCTLPNLHLVDITDLPQKADPSISCDLPTLAEMQVVVRKLMGGKAPGVSGIHGEFLIDGGEAVENAWHTILCSVWNSGMIPSD